jgi:hypothetical protein
MLRHPKGVNSNGRIAATTVFLYFEISSNVRGESYLSAYVFFLRCRVARLGQEELRKNLRRDLCASGVRRTLHCSAALMKFASEVGRALVAFGAAPLAGKLSSPIIWRPRMTALLKRRKFLIDKTAATAVDRW